MNELEIGTLVVAVTFTRRMLDPYEPVAYPIGTLVRKEEFPHARLPTLLYPIDDPTADRIYEEVEQFVRWLSPLELLALQADE